MEWISVKDRLPEKNGRYQAWFENGNPGYCLYFEDSGWVYGYNSYESGWVVTHWMPLPKPPK